ncbi:MAG: hypothetical protein R2795_24890 [Saprospiraceae bacterium]
MIRMQPGSSMEIVDGAKVRFIRNTEFVGNFYIMGCFVLWKGIYVKNGELEMLGVTISDAETAVHLSQDATATLRDNTFLTVTMYAFITMTLDMST